MSLSAVPDLHGTTAVCNGEIGPLARHRRTTTLMPATSTTSRCQFDE